MLLKALISGHSSLTFLGEAENALVGREKILALKPDAIFLDIHLPDATGIDLLKSLDSPPFVVFVTLSEKHALPAIDFDPIDYLLKPLTVDRFATTVARLEKRFHSAQALAQILRAEPLLGLRMGTETRMVALSEIAAVQAAGNYIHVFLQEKPAVFVATPIGEYQQSLPSPPFLRLDRSLVVNLKHVAQTERLSRDLTRLRLHGIETPFDLGRVAVKRLRDALKNGPASFP